MSESDIELFLKINEPVFEIGGKQYSVCCPGEYFATWDEDEKTFDYPDIQTLLDKWIVGGRPFREVVEQIM